MSNTGSPENPQADALEESLLWDVRAFVYQTFAAASQPPTVADTAARFQIGVDEATALYHELDGRHAFFLEPGTTDIRIANPFSAVPTGFRVEVLGRSYWANCAWDALGIPAALHADALIEATDSGGGEPLLLSVRDGQLHGDGAVAHFVVPFDNWYDDMVFT